jgi:sugar O-acyltransferase (sialic acid O-acetyltransferase NeuD family)
VKSKKEEVVIVGAGGHGREIADIIHTTPHQKLLGFIDENVEIHKRLINGIPVLGGFSFLSNLDRNSVKVICAIGTPTIHKALIQRTISLGFQFTNVISPSSIISSSATISHGVVVFPQVSVGANATLKSFSCLNVGVTVSHDTLVQEYAIINPGAHLAGNVTIGIGCMVGMGSNIIQGCSVGDWTTIGAGTVVVKDMPANVTAVGVPARIIYPK